MDSNQSAMDLMNLPPEMIDKILSYLSFDQIAKLRSVNRMFNEICSHKLNKGFVYVNQFHSRCLKAVKTKLPRRESERRHHPLARHSDILMAVETRLSMLSMTFGKYIEAHQCCFIPGKVLDEALKVLRIVNGCLTPSQSSGQFPLLPRPHDFLQEYRDVSSMAMEHFDDKILPGIKENMRLPNNLPLYCFKRKSDPSPFLNFPRRVEVSRLREFKQVHQFPPVEASGSASGAGSNTSSPAEKKCEVGGLVWRAYRGVQGVKLKFKSMHQSMDKLRQTFRQVNRQMKLENVVLRAQMAQQKTMIKHLRRELRETRTAMNAMSKDLNQIKLDQSQTGGIKRKRESCDEGICERKLKIRKS